jgi:hypothetical protein
MSNEQKPAVINQDALQKALAATKHLFVPSLANKLQPFLDQVNMYEHEVDRLHRAWVIMLEKNTGFPPGWATLRDQLVEKHRAAMDLYSNKLREFEGIASTIKPAPPAK